MSKSLIKTVDGIGIWVRDDATFGSVSTIEFWVGIVSFIIMCACEILWLIDNACWAIAMIAGAISSVVSMNSAAKQYPAYEVYPGSGDGITIIKTTDPKADQLAICKAAQQIESRCHEIAAKRAELDRIAAGCK